MHPAGSDLPTASPPGPSWRCAGFIKPATTRIKETTKCPEPLRPISALPPLGRRDPPPRRALPLLHRYYWLIRQTHLALPSSGVPRAVRGEPALLGAESRAGTGLPVVDIARLENAATGRVDRVERGGAATQLATDRQ